jgi:hypothetical protein
MLATLRYPQGYTFYTAGGSPAADGSLYYYAAGTTTPRDTFSDSSGTTANANPVVLNGSGQLSSAVYLGPSTYKEVFMHGGAIVPPWPDDNIPFIRPSSPYSSTYAPMASARGVLGQLTHDADYTFVRDDAGYSHAHDSATGHSWTIPSDTFLAGEILDISTGQSSGTLSILAGSGLTLLREDGTAGTGTRTLGAASSAVVKFRSATVAEIRGVFAS